MIFQNDGTARSIIASKVRIVVNVPQLTLSPEGQKLVNGNYLRLVN